ncbi:DUF1997 domain-containing protein [Phormidium sp. CLA17]|uniref:DUF1997 domain-containing protein n=1 Tax=Leptolyngbya sp. Cla-17 TaxID=2803751 RepID=UPI0014915635|nr:DUF1997 domain-containing protein [Leptolyngbya sp. Cla-17]MBM0741880.1 DUF1997 domain-containing protein [Leptolyngbya sp. Cla-17]
MQSYRSTEQPAEVPNGVIHTASVLSNAGYSVSVTEDTAQPVNEPMRFYSQFEDHMEMCADAHTVAQYLDHHHEWFHRCAHPMKVEPIGTNSYALLIGRFGSFGYEVEPKIGLDLLPQQEGIYRIETVPVPGYSAVGYDVDFRAAMELVEGLPECNHEAQSDRAVLPVTTCVQWQLDLTVMIQFPRFIHALPKALVQSTGDRLLRQIIRQVSTRLTHKVLEDFHQTHGLTIPKRSNRWFFRKSETDLDS